MNTSNPFVPTVALITVPDRSRGGRLKLGLYTIIAVPLVFFGVLLIRDWRSDYLTATATEAPGSAASGVSPSETIKRKPQAGPVSRTPSAPTAPAALQLNATPTPSAQPISKDSVAQGATHSEVFHVIRSGDTLFEISKTYGTTVRAVKVANGLSSERLVVGTRLKIPSGAMLAASTVQN